MDQDSFRDIYNFIFKEIRNKFRSNMTIFDNCVNLVDILNTICSQSDELREMFVRMEEKNTAWIPGPGFINLEKGIGSCTGNLLEHHSVLGPFF